MLWGPWCKMRWSEMFIHVHQEATRQILQVQLSGSRWAHARAASWNKQASGKSHLFCSTANVAIQTFGALLVLEQRNETQLREDMDKLKQANQALLADLQLMKKERELAKPLIPPATGQISYAATRQAKDRVFIRWCWWFSWIYGAKLRWMFSQPMAS